MKFYSTIINAAGMCEIKTVPIMWRCRHGENDNYNMCITTNQPDTKSNPHPNSTILNSAQ